MSFLMDGPLLVGAGALTGVLTDDPKLRAALGGATLSGFYAVSLSLYMEAGWTRPIWRMVGARSGRDWMVNSRVLKFDVSRMQRRHHAMAGAFFASYVLWFAAGLWLGDRIRRTLERRRSTARYPAEESEQYESAPHDS
jgi:hypothetical protein